MQARGVCPSCNGCRMAQIAAHLVDRVIPPVPVRQWVISVPTRLRCFLADSPSAVAALTPIWPRSPRRCAVVLCGGSVCSGSSAPMRPSICSAGKTAGARSLRVFESRSSTATCRAIFKVSSTCCDTLPVRPLRWSGFPSGVVKTAASPARYVLPRHKAANWVGPGRS